MIPIKDEIFARMDELSPAEKKVARSLLANYPSAGLASAATLARAAGTSTPTVLRLVSRLGIGGYPEFQTRLRQEVTQQLNAPVTPAPPYRLTGRGDGTVPVARSPSGSAWSSGSTDGAAERVRHGGGACWPARPRRSCSPAATSPATSPTSSRMQLDQLIPGVAAPPSRWAATSASICRWARTRVVIVFDLRRYELPAKRVAALARQQGASVIVITDEGSRRPPTMPTSCCRSRSTACRSTRSPGCMVLVEALVEGGLPEVWAAPGSTDEAVGGVGAHPPRVPGRADLRTDETDDRRDEDDVSELDGRRRRRHRHRPGHRPGDRRTSCGAAGATVHGVDKDDVDLVGAPPRSRSSSPGSGTSTSWSTTPAG